MTIGVAGRLVAGLASLLLLVVAGWLVAIYNRPLLGVTSVAAEPGRGGWPPPDPLAAQSAGPASPGAAPSVAEPGSEAEAAPAVVTATSDWVNSTAVAAGLPPLALRAYANAELRMRAERPECALSWATLAGIGWLESHQGTVGFNALGPDGRPTRGPIVGIRLDGAGPVAAIADTDAGSLDGDAEWDRAVGPMQLLPTTWGRNPVDADGDGADPQDIDDAALVAASALCAAGTPLTDAAQWRAAILAYNRSDAYVADVLSATNFYAGRSAG